MRRSPAGSLRLQELIASSEKQHRMSRDEQDVFLSYTGGTTGLPKGVRYTIGRGVTNSLRLREEFLETSTELGIVDYAAEQARNGNSLVAIPASPLMHKLATEKYLFFYHAQYGIDYVAMRYANVYGPRQDPHGEAGVVAIFCGRMLEDRPVTIYGDGGQTRDYVFVADVVRANMAAVASNVSGAFNVGTGVETDVNQLYAALARIAGTDRAPEFGPPRAGEQRRSVILPARAAKELGWRPQVELSDGLAQTLRFFRDRAAR